VEFEPTNPVSRNSKTLRDAFLFAAINGGALGLKHLRMEEADYEALRKLEDEA
jgi:hypothetical protein